VGKCPCFTLYVVLPAKFLFPPQLQQQQTQISPSKRLKVKKTMHRYFFLFFQSIQMRLARGFQTEQQITSPPPLLLNKGIRRCDSIGNACF
jgi:hypothetical protein